jgi:hypothetical protein
MEAPDDTTPTDPMNVTPLRRTSSGSQSAVLSSSSRLSWPAAARDLLTGLSVSGGSLWVLYMEMQKAQTDRWVAIAALAALGLVGAPAAFLGAIGKVSGAAKSKLKGGE